MSWTVQEDHSGQGNMDSLDNIEALLKVVDDADNEELFPPARIVSQEQGSRLPQPFARAPARGAYTKASQVFVSPAPLTPADVATPVKDPMEGFNTWMRGQTPTSNRNSPTPTGGFVSMSSAATPGSAPRHLNMNMNTPSKGGFAPRESRDGHSPLQRNPNLETIQEHRRHLMLQMEELEMQELELRRTGSYNNQDRGSNNQSRLFGLNPFAASFGGTPTQGGQQPPMTAESIRGRVYEIAKDQHGCRFLQRALDSNYDREMAQVIMQEIVPFVPELMTDQYANFLVQKLFDMMPHDVRFNVAKVAARQMPSIALTAHGTFSVQKLIETITTREEMLVVRDALSADVVRLVVDVHGNHVIQKVLQRFDHPDKQFIYDAVSTDCANIAMNKQGCCVLQRCLEFASPDQHRDLVTTILSVALQIVQDPFGNYVVQYVLESCDPSVNDRIGRMFIPSLTQLAVNKFSSNVLEKVLRQTSQAVRDLYCEALSDLQLATRLISDDYGNYVIQTALTTGSAGVVETLVHAIRPLLHLIRNAPYAKKLEAKMDVISRKKFSPTSSARGFRGSFPSATAAPFSPVSPQQHQPTLSQSASSNSLTGGNRSGHVEAGANYPTPTQSHNMSQPHTPQHQQSPHSQGHPGRGGMPQSRVAESAVVDAIAGGQRYPGATNGHANRGANRGRRF